MDGARWVVGLALILAIQVSDAWQDKSRDNVAHKYYNHSSPHRLAFFFLCSSSSSSGTAENTAFGWFFCHAAGGEVVKASGERHVMTAGQQENLPVVHFGSFSAISAYFSRASRGCVKGTLQVSDFTIRLFPARSLTSSPRLFSLREETSRSGFFYRKNIQERRVTHLNMCCTKCCVALAPTLPPLPAPLTGSIGL
jgi:hypothetical protein